MGRAARTAPGLRDLAPIAWLALLGCAFTPGHAAESAPPPGPGARTYALVAAFSDRFQVVHQTTPRDRVPGSSIRTDEFRRVVLDAPGGTFNRVALAGLAKAVARHDPGARLVFLAQSGATPPGVAAPDREDFLLRRVAAELEGMPQRRDWHRIVVALPAYRALDFDGMPGRLEGFGLFMQPNCQSDPRSCGSALRPPSAPETYGPDDREVPANFFVAPFAFVAIVVLDPATLAVLDREHKLDYRRYFDPVAGTLDLSRNIPKETLAPKVVGLIERSLDTAISRTELAGKVEIRDVKEVKP
jgi:hypothetical protein